MRTSEQIDHLAEALAVAQGAFKNPERNREVDTGSYKFSYSTLDCVIDSVREALSKNGLCLIQASEIEDGLLVVTTRIAHSSGQWIESDLAAKPADMSPQKIGSVITYLRRYAICGVLGIASEEDDDGHQGSAVASKPRPQQKAATKTKAAEPEPSTFEKAKKRLEDVLDGQKIRTGLEWIDASDLFSETEKAHLVALGFSKLRDFVILSSDDDWLDNTDAWAQLFGAFSQEQKDAIRAKVATRRKQIEAVAVPENRHG